MTHELPACWICGHAQWQLLEVPHPDQSMLSDGRIWPVPLRKAVCAACGVVTHASAATDAAVRQFYSTDYSLGAAPGAPDLLRNAAYADLVIEFVRTHCARRVLEVGCGSGQVLVRLANQFPETDFVGLEAAERLASRHVGQSGVAIHHGFIEDLPSAAEPYDFVYSINVIEHAADPVRFLKAIGGQLSPDGRVLLICPTARPANLELVFQDHMNSFTQAAFNRIAARAGFRVLASTSRLPGFPGFQSFLLGAQAIPDMQDATGDLDYEGERAIEVAAYLQAWKNLDGALMSRIGGVGETRVFGAGEMAALLRCYAPRSWQTVRAIVVDDPIGCRDLGVPVIRADELRPDAKPLVLGVHPLAQGALSRRFKAAGFKTVQFDDLIAG